MLPKHFLSTATLVVVITILGLVLFPPWCTVISGNAYPKVTFRWFRATPQPVGGSVYQIDVVRLQDRLAIVALAFTIIVVGNKLHRRFRKGVGS